MSRPAAVSASAGHLPIDDEVSSRCDSDISSNPSSGYDPSRQVINCPGSEYSAGPRRNNFSTCSRVSFHSIFGDSEDQNSTASQDFMDQVNSFIFSIMIIVYYQMLPLLPFLCLSL